MFTLFLSIYILAIVVTAHLFIKSLKHRYLPMAAPVCVFSLILMAICTLQVLEFSVDNLFYLQFISDAAFLLLFTVIPLWVWGFYEYQAERKLLPKWFLLLWVEPLIAGLIYFINGFWLFDMSDSLINSSHEIIKPETRMGSFLLVHRYYMIFMGFIILCWAIYLVKEKTQRAIKELLLFACCLAIPMILVYLYRVGIIPIRLGAPALVFLLLWATHQYRLLDIVPLALNNIMNTIKTGLMVVNAQGQLVYANTFAAQVFNIESLLTHLHKRPLPQLAVLDQYFDFTQTESQSINIVLESEKKQQFIDACIEPLYRHKKSHLGHVISLQDVSKRKEAELLLASQAKKLADFDRQKSEFFAGISHEFRTPLTLSLGYLKNIRQGEHGNSLVALQNPLKIIYDNNQRLLELVNQLLELSQLEADAWKIYPESIELDIFLPMLISLFTPMADKQRILIQFFCDVEDSTIYFDHDALEKIVQNLLSNGFKSMPEGGKLNLSISDVDKDHLQLIVEDMGCGIDSQILPHIFEPFFYRDHNCALWQRGAGIGLSLVKQLLNLHQASISVSSVLQEGSCFKVIFQKGYQHFSDQSSINMNSHQMTGANLTKASVNSTLLSTTENSHVHIAQPLVADQKLSERLILIVEDNADMRAYIRFHLGKEYRLIEAADGEEGLTLAQQLLPDLVLSDVMMPVMDGLDLCSQLKGNLLTSHIPVLLLTAKSHRKEKLVGLQQGADDYLTKPFDVQELQVRLANLIQSRLILKKAYQQHWQQGVVDSIQLPATEVHFLEVLREYIVEHIANPDIYIADLANLVHMSERTLNRKLKALTGETPKQLLLSVRLHYAAKLLKTSHLSITEVSYNSGFSDASYFVRKFKATFNQTPKHYRQLSDLSCELAD